MQFTNKLKINYYEAYLVHIFVLISTSPKLYLKCKQPIWDTEDGQSYCNTANFLQISFVWFLLIFLTSE